METDADRPTARVNTLSQLMAKHLPQDVCYRTNVVCSTLECVTQVLRWEALGVASAFRTVSDRTVTVIAGVIPIALLPKERTPINEANSEDLGELVASGERQRKTHPQPFWQNEPRGRRAVRLIDHLYRRFSV